jgi:hypothetical protein
MNHNCASTFHKTFYTIKDIVSKGGRMQNFLNCEIFDRTVLILGILRPLYTNVKSSTKEFKLIQKS